MAWLEILHQRVAKLGGQRQAALSSFIPAVCWFAALWLLAVSSEHRWPSTGLWVMLILTTLGLAALTGYAEAIGLDMIRFSAEMADRVYTQRVQEHRRAGQHSGVRATPAFFLDGRLVDVSLGFDKLEAAVRAALKS